MNQGFGGEKPRDHSKAAHRAPVRYVVVIDSDGSAVARLFLASRELVAEFDAGAEETAQMTTGLTPSPGATGAEWDKALEGHSVAERQAAQVYTIDI